MSESIMDMESVMVMPHCEVKRLIDLIIVELHGEVKIDLILWLVDFSAS